MKYLEYGKEVNHVSSAYSAAFQCSKNNFHEDNITQRQRRLQVIRETLKGTAALLHCYESLFS